MRRATHLFLLCLFLIVAFKARPADRPPNVILFFADDMGYADIGPFGSKISTPHLDRMAAEGVKFTDFHVSQAVCSASRASLLTGCYNNRVGILGALGPNAQIGIHDSELLLSELFKQKGYATAIFGKWHLGHHPQFLPTRHGFDEYFGLPYSNDMWPKHPTAKFPDLPLIDGEKTVELNPDQRRLTTEYTRRGVSFIERSKDKPFLLYLPHAMPHVPLFVSGERDGKTRQGLFADVIAEIDWSVGQVLDALERNGLDEHTLVIFTSDNGPWLSYGDHAGSAGRFREGKGTTFEGGNRVPCLMRWPGRIPAGSVSKELAATIDILPTMAKLIGVPLSTDRIIDGKDILPLMTDPAGARTPHEVYLMYWGRHLQAVRAGRWKLHFPHAYVKPDPPGNGGKPGRITNPRIELSLFDLDADPSESTNVADKHPDVVGRLQALADAAREDLGDSETRQEGKNVRPSGKL